MIELIDKTGKLIGILSDIEENFIIIDNKKLKLSDVYINKKLKLLFEKMLNE